MPASDRALAAIRRFLLALLAAGLVVTAVELALLDHDEDVRQFVPLVLIAAAMGVVAWHAVRPSGASLRALQAIMALFVVAAGAGLYFHAEGSREFQLETDPTQHGWPLFMKVMRSKAPPALAPAVMAELGAIGLAYAYASETHDRSGS